MASATAFVDDKSPLCIPFILNRLAAYRKEAAASPSRRRPFIVGLNGVQGVGKTTLVRALADTFQQQEGLETLVVSIDDFYLTRADQQALADAHPDNRLVQVRGEPGTHDTALLQSFFDAVCAGQPTRVPEYDKAAFAGLGDRLAPTPANPGRLVNAPSQRPLQVVILEGWCVGFRHLDPAEVERKRNSACSPFSQLHNHPLAHLLFVNNALAAYDAAVTSRLDALIYLDAQHTEYVYAWRREQEAALRQARGTGMTDEQVDRFVDAYYPAYELYSDGLRRGLFLRGDHSSGTPAEEGAGQHGRQLHVVVGRDRRVISSSVI